MWTLNVKMDAYNIQHDKLISNHFDRWEPAMKVMLIIVKTHQRFIVVVMTVRYSYYQQQA